MVAQRSTVWLPLQMQAEKEIVIVELEFQILQEVSLFMRLPPAEDLRCPVPHSISLSCSGITVKLMLMESAKKKHGLTLLAF